MKLKDRHPYKLPVSITLNYEQRAALLYLIEDALVINDMRNVPIDIDHETLGIPLRQARSRLRMANNYVEH